MRLFDFTPELVGRIFEEFACSRDLKRFMRLRIVNRQFRYFVDDTIFRLRLLDDLYISVSWRGPSRRLDQWFNYAVEYLAYQAWRQKRPNSPRGRIYRAAEIISKQVGDTEQSAIRARLKSLCRLALGNSSCYPHVLRLFYSNPAASVRYSDETLEMDLCVAAVYLGYRQYIEKLISHGCQFQARGTTSDAYSDVFGEPYGAAIFSGDVSMLRLLLSSNPDCSQFEPISSTLQQHILRLASVIGQKDVFNFILDLRPLNLTGGEVGRTAWHPEYECLRDAIASTRHPENYERGASMFIPNSRIFDTGWHGDPWNRLITKAQEGHVEMVRYFLDKISRSSQDADDELKQRHKTYSPLLKAVEGGDPDIVKLLLDHGQDPNWFQVVETALMAAARFSRLTIAKMLLQAGAKANEGCPPPIVLAVFKEDMDMFRLLRQYGARLDTPDTGNRAMAVAQFYELESMVDVLVEEGVERGAVLHRCAVPREEYERGYLFPQCRLNQEQMWLNAIDEYDD